MNILAFDTCLDKMYVSISKNDNILPSKIVETTKEHYHSAFLISTIKDIVKENGLTPQDIDVVVTNIGPGSFTGIRACTTVARVFAQGVNEDIKTVGVSSLEILSRLNVTQFSHFSLQEESVKLLTSHLSPLTLVALDARKDMAYVAIFEGKKPILEPKTILVEEVKKMIAENDYFIVTDDKLEPIIGGISYQKSDADLGKFLIQIAYEKLETNINTDWKKLHPLYIQPPPITIKKQK